MDTIRDQFNSTLEAVIGNNNVLGELGVIAFLILLLTSLVSSLFIGYLYLTFYRKKSSGMHIYRAFPLLGISITTIFVCIQFSLSLSLGLLGALSIVRFRTPVKEPEEIGFIMLLIAASIAIATFNIAYLIVLLIVSTAGLYLLNRYLAAYRSTGASGVLLFSLDAKQASVLAADIEAFLPTLLLRPRCENASDDGKDVTLCYRFDGIHVASIAEVSARFASRFEARGVKIYAAE